MILSCNFEEIQALLSGAELLLEGGYGGTAGAVVAPTEAMTHVALLQPRLTGCLSIETLAEQRSVRRAVAAICSRLHECMDETVVEYHPAHEEAVAYYFDYAHAYAVLRRLDEMGSEMTAIIELTTGEKPTGDSAESVNFAD